MAAGNYQEFVLLLVAVSGGVAVHVVRRHEPPEMGRGAVPNHYLMGDSKRAAVQRRYDVEALRKPVWEHTTMCGRVWALMAAVTAGR
ncbi:hypothetical protein [Micromonospora aurantiaca (nom. illeg.)]|uniref:hypothetical protein n=1 Tax=Micromonospora aurantiaca (nom. illeg.) TaxID=47850 RepID=UPI0033EDBDBC